MQAEPLAPHTATAAVLLALLAVAGAQQISLVAGPGCADLPPAPPTALRAVPADGSVTLVWGRPSNGACVTTYQVSVFPVDASTQRSFDRPTPQSTPQFNLTVAGLQNGVAYRFFVKVGVAWGLLFLPCSCPNRMAVWVNGREGSGR